MKNNYLLSRIQKKLPIKLYYIEPKERVNSDAKERSNRRMGKRRLLFVVYVNSCKELSRTHTSFHYQTRTFTRDLSSGPICFDTSVSNECKREERVITRTYTRSKSRVICDYGRVTCSRKEARPDGRSAERQAVSYRETRV